MIAESISTQASAPIESRCHVSIVILTWNGIEYTRRCLATLRENTSFDAYSVVVVDNGSSDGTVEYLRTLPWLRVVANETNLGFTRGCNIGIAASPPGSDVVLLNNDTEIHQRDWLERMHDVARSAADIGIVGCRLAGPPGKLQHAGTEIMTTYFGTQIGGDERDVNQYHRNRDVQGVVFACVYLKREVIDDVGRLDEDYHSYFEDSDYCLKARDRGYRTVCCGEVTIQHRQHAAVDVNRARLSALYMPSRETFRRKWAARLEAERRWRVGWRSILSSVDGYASVSRNLVLALERRGVEIRYQSAYGPGTVRPSVEPPESESERIRVIRGRKIERADAEVVFAQGDLFQANFGAYRIGFTMLEVDGVPAEWVRLANEMNEVWVPTSFNLETFRASGVERRIHVIPFGIDPDYFHPEITSFHPGNAFVFLSVFEWGERKAPEILLRAFNDEFGAAEDAVLFCRVLNRDTAVDVASDVRRLGLRSGGGRVLMSLNEVIPYHQIAALYRSADCFVLSTRGEGWGMPILEAMACGLPVIATDWGAARDFMNASNAYPLQIDRLVPAVARCPYYEGFRWAEPSYEHLRALMRHVYDNRDEARAKGLEASRQASERWTWDHSARRIVARLEEMNETKAKP